MPDDYRRASLEIWDVTIRRLGEERLAPVTRSAGYGLPGLCLNVPAE